jgi:hypothetical protein
VSIFLVVYDDNEPVGCGGLRDLAGQGLPGQAEVKRLYVVLSQAPSVALFILNALERAASELNFTALKVETGKGMPQARRFYERYDHLPCEVFGGYKGSDHSVCYEKVLV